MLVGIFPNLSKENIVRYVDELCRHLDAADIDYRMWDRYRAEMNERGYHFAGERWASWDELIDRMDMAISLGGDGTLISVAKQIFPTRVPIVGVNLGDLGFLNVIERNNLDERLQKIKSGAYHLVERTVLDAAILTQDGEKNQLPMAVNEVVVGRSKPGKMARLRLYINNVYVEEYPADGIIIATATGSTGYALSCGGPILYPGLDSLLVIPVCPHLLQSAPLLIGRQDEVMITMPEREKQLYASIDGNESFHFNYGRRLVIRAHEQTIPFVQFNDQNFFQSLFPKLSKSIYHDHL